MISPQPHTAVVLFLVQLAATLTMTGLIWFVQVVHYPLFAAVGDAAFVSYEQRHATLTSRVVGLPMVLELGTAILALVPALRPSFVKPVEAFASALLVLLLWGATGLILVPLHNQLGRQNDAALLKRLVSGNWLRTVAWSARSGLLIASLAAPLMHS